MKRRPKWSTVTIALAVIAALAIASPVLGVSKSIKKAIKKEVAKQISSATGPQGSQGSPGQPGAPGSALAFAFVKGSLAGATDTVDESRSKNITDANVTHPATGIWCFNGLTFTVSNAVAAPTGSRRLPTIQGIEGDASSCTGDEAVLVHQVIEPGGADDDTGFMVLLN